MEFSRSHPILIPRVLVAFGRVTENEKRELCSVPFKVSIVFVVVLTELHLKHSNSYRSINSKLQHPLSNPLGIWTLKITSFILPPRPPTRLKLCSNAPPKCRIDRQFFVERQNWRSWLCGPQFLSHLLTKVNFESLNTSLLKDETLFQWKDVTVLVQISCHNGPRSNSSLPGHGRQLNAHGLAGGCWSSKLICAWASKVIFGEETLSFRYKNDCATYLVC